MKKFIAIILLLSSFSIPVLSSVSANAEGSCKKSVNPYIKLLLSNIDLENEVDLMDKFLNIYPFEEKKADSVFRDWMTLVHNSLKNSFSAYRKFKKSRSEQECEKNYNELIDNFASFEFFKSNKDEYLKDKCTKEDFINIEKKFEQAANVYLDENFGNKIEL